MDGLTKSNLTSNQLLIRWMILDLELQQLHEIWTQNTLTLQICSFFLQSILSAE